MGSNDMFDTADAYPDGRNFTELYEALPDNGDDFKRIYRDCD